MGRGTWVQDVWFSRDEGGWTRVEGLVRGWETEVFKVIMLFLHV